MNEARELHEALARLASATGEAAETRELLRATREPFLFGRYGTRVHLVAHVRFEGDRFEVEPRALVDWCTDLATAKACLGADVVGTDVARAPCPTCGAPAWRVVRELATVGGGTSTELLLLCGRGHRTSTHRANGSLLDAGRVFRTPADWPEPWRTWAHEHETLATRIAEAWRPGRHDQVAFAAKPEAQSVYFARELVSDEARASIRVGDRLRSLDEMPRTPCTCGGAAFVLFADELQPGSYDAEWDMTDVSVCFACGRTTERYVGRGLPWPR
ncbi:MAG: hypothetical protein KC586_21930 [Myxococcales bacterium]|nr:hypothetical protein [Myxococcales bacterium]